MLCPAAHTNQLHHCPAFHLLALQVVERAVADLAAKYNKDPKDPVVRASFVC